MNGIRLIFKTSVISLSPHRPPDAMWNDFPPSLLALASTSSNPAAEQICSVLRHGPFCVCERKI
ncbi:hypothetical protein H5410_026308 [Solanum commersonii]|uniref:Uncharacterized protein n=1 Tax=Solanum commersonii TaxID=4109 RepID=A0A9J5YYE7_SOLCO|nr:hypothetical protein H5410_026308 [Solanum commersonii]